MEVEIIIAKRFRAQTFRIFQHLQKKFSSKTALLFLEKIEERLELIAKHPTIGKQSGKKKDVRSIRFTPHNIIFDRINGGRVEILCLFDSRRDPIKKPY